MCLSRNSLARGGLCCRPARLISLLPVALAVLVAACASGTPTVRRTLTPTVRSPSPTALARPTAVPTPPPAPPSIYFRTDDDQLYALNAADGSLRWKVPEKFSSESPALAHNLVYVQDPASGTVSALRALDGTALWTVHSDGSFTLAGGLLFTIIVSNGHNTLAALDALTGQPRWTWQGDIINTDIVSAPEGVFVVSVRRGTPQPGGAPSVAASTLVALDSSSGAVRWSFPRTAEALGDPVVSAGTVYMPANTQTAGHLYALAADDGALRWTADTAPLQFGHTLDVANGLVYGSGSAGVYALGASDGHQVWKFERPNTASALVAGDTVYLTTFFSSLDTPGIFALDAITGALRWSFHLVSNPLNAPPVATDALVYIPTRPIPADAAALYALHATSGAAAWSFQAPLVYPVVSGDTVYDDAVLPGGSTVYAFAAASGAVQWKYQVGAHLTTFLVASG